MSVTPVVRTIREQIVEQIRREVLSGQLVEGEALREESLAKRFGVSRGPIRDALLQLSQEGLLQSRPNCGAKVAPGPSPAIQPLVIQLRRQIESFAVELIFDRLTPHDMEALQAILERLRTACEDEDIAALVDHDMAFHRWFVDRVGDADLTKMWLAIVTRMWLRYTRHTHLMDSFAEHQEVTAAIRRGDKVGAIEALVNNIRH
jgi:DNA-binding GntR family transcriptional regulator